MNSPQSVVTRSSESILATNKVFEKHLYASGSHIIIQCGYCLGFNELYYAFKRYGFRIQYCCYGFDLVCSS